MNTLETTFLEALERGGKQITDFTGNTFTAFTRKIEDKKQGADWLSIYCPVSANISVGAAVLLNSTYYICTTADSENSLIYKRLDAVRSNKRASLSQLEIGKDEFGDDVETLTTYAKDIPVYATTELSKIQNLEFVNILGGATFIVMPAYKINAKVVLTMKKFNEKNEFVDTSFKIQSIDATDVYTSDNGDIYGILRLQASS